MRPAQFLRDRNVTVPYDRTPRTAVMGASSNGRWQSSNYTKCGAVTGTRNKESKAWRGFQRFARGLFRFLAICSVGPNTGELAVARVVPMFCLYFSSYYYLFIYLFIHTHARTCLPLVCLIFCRGQNQSTEQPLHITQN